MHVQGGTRARTLVPPSLSLAVLLTTLCGIVAAGPFGIVAADAQMTSPPSEEKQSPQPRRSAGNPKSGNPEAIEAGRKLYTMWCIQCHGPKADGVSRFGKYAADLREFWRGYREFVTIVKNGRPDRQMPPWKDVLDDAKIAQLGAYLETLAIEGANWK
jgi:mono/diheme cytochrome c family protein